MTDQAKESHSKFVVLVFLATTFVLHIVFGVLSLRSVLFALAGMFLVPLTIGVAFYLVDVLLGRALARFATPGPRTDAIVVNLGCLLSVVQAAATITVTVYSFRAFVLRTL